MDISSSVHIVELTKAELKQAAELVSKTMASNPINVAVFKSTGEKVIKKQQRMFEYALNQPGKKIYAAKLKGELVGIMCYTSSDCCQLKPLELIRKLPELIMALGSHLLPVLMWQKKWGKHDYKRPHSHLGPVAVAVIHQGKGIGKMLLTSFCAYLDETSQTGYLETDKQVNVILYQKFGFRVIEEDLINNVRNWYMIRDTQK